MLFTERFRTRAEIESIRLEELSFALLMHLRATIESDTRDSYRCVNMHTVCYTLGELYAANGEGRIRDLKRVIGEAWNWLVARGLIALDPDSSDGQEYFITRLGNAIQSEDLFAEYEKRRCISSDVLHTNILQEAYGDFIMGDYEAAVLKAFRRIEIAVRNASEQLVGDNAVKVVRTAFHQDNGKLTELDELPGERQAMSDLFAGAMGRYRNPAAHGSREFIDVVETAELLMFASHLLKIVDARREC